MDNNNQSNGSGGNVGSARSSDALVSSLYSELDQGLDCMWNNKLDEADALFGKNKQKTPRHALHFGEVMVFRSVITEQASDRHIAIERMQQAIQLAEQHIKSFENSNKPEEANLLLDTRVVLADACVMIAALQIVEEQRVKGLLNMRRAWKVYRQALNAVEKDKTTYDAVVVSNLKFGAGLFFFIISLIPPGLPQKVAALAGFKGGDKKLGVRYLRECYEQKSIRSYLAGMTLAFDLIWLNVSLDNEIPYQLLGEADAIIKDGAERYPQGSLFQALAAVAALEKNEVDSATMSAQVAIANAKHITDYPSVFLRVQSNCHEMKYDFTRLEKILESILEQGIEQDKKGKIKNPWSLPWNTLRLGACEIALGKSDRAKKLFEDTEKTKTKDPWTIILKQQAAKYLKTGGHYAMYELMFLTGILEKSLRNTPDARRQQLLDDLEAIATKAEGSLTPLGVSPRSEKKFSSFFKKASVNVGVENRCCYLNLKAVILRSLKKTQECIACVDEIIRYQQLTDKMYHALALLTYGKVLLKEENNRTEATKNFEMIMKMNDFMWENPIKSQARMILEQLGIEQKAPEDTGDVDTADIDKLLEDEDIGALIKEEQDEQQINTNA